MSNRSLFRRHDSAHHAMLFATMPHSPSGFAVDAPQLPTPSKTPTTGRVWRGGKPVGTRKEVD